MSADEPLDLDEIAQSIGRPDEQARSAARDRHELLAKPVGSLGRLEDLSIWLAGIQGSCPTRPLKRVRLVVFAADHGIAAAGVSAYPPTATGQLMRTFLDGGGAGSVLAHVVGAEMRVLDVGVSSDSDDDASLPSDTTRFKVRRGSGRIDVEDVLTRHETEQAFRAGMTVTDEEVDAGADLLVLGDVGVGSTTHAAAIVGTLLRLDASVVIGRGSGIDDDTWMRKCAAIRDAMRRGRRVLPDQLQLLASTGGADFAAMTGFLLQASARRTPVILDGLVSSASALVAHRICFRAADWWLAGHRSTEPAHKLALDRLALKPVLDLGLRVGQGAGALLAVPLLQGAATLLGEMSTYAEAAISFVPADEERGGEELT